MYLLQCITCLLVIVFCTYNIYTENKRQKHMDMIFENLKKKWKEQKEIGDD